MTLREIMDAEQSPRCPKCGAPLLIDHDCQNGDWKIYCSAKYSSSCGFEAPISKVLSDLSQFFPASGAAASPEILRPFEDSLHAITENIAWHLVKEPRSVKEITEYMKPRIRQLFAAYKSPAAPPVDVRELAKEIVRKFCFPTTDPDFPGTVAAEQVKAISEIINRALGQEDRASVCTKIYNSIPVQAYTIKCSACKQHMAVATAPTFCPACGEKFTEWRDESEPRA